LLLTGQESECSIFYRFISFFRELMDTHVTIISLKINMQCQIFSLRKILVHFKLIVVNKHTSFLLLIDSSVGIVMGYKIDCRDSISGRGNNFLSTPQRPVRLWNPQSLLSNGYRGPFPRG
jgi:hypothetical protein